MVSIRNEQLQQVADSIADWPAGDRVPRFEIIDDQMAEILRRKSDVQRLRSVDSFWRSARAILRAAIVTEHPNWDRDRVNVEISRRISNGAVNNARSD